MRNDLRIWFFIYCRQHTVDIMGIIDNNRRHRHLISRTKIIKTSGSSKTSCYWYHKPCWNDRQRWHHRHHGHLTDHGYHLQLLSVKAGYDRQIQIPRKKLNGRPTMFQAVSRFAAENEESINSRKSQVTASLNCPRSYISEVIGIYCKCITRYPYLRGQVRLTLVMAVMRLLQAARRLVSWFCSAITSSSRMTVARLPPPPPLCSGPPAWRPELQEDSRESKDNSDYLRWKSDMT